MLEEIKFIPFFGQVFNSQPFGNVLDYFKITIKIIHTPVFDNVEFSVTGSWTISATTLKKLFVLPQ